MEGCCGHLERGRSTVARKKAPREVTHPLDDPAIPPSSMLTIAPASFRSLEVERRQSRPMSRRRKRGSPNQARKASFLAWTGDRAGNVDRAGLASFSSSDRSLEGSRSIIALKPCRRNGASCGASCPSCTSSFTDPVHSPSVARWRVCSDAPRKRLG